MQTYIQYPAMIVPLVRCTELPMLRPPLAVTAQLEASQVELTVLHRNGAFCVPSDQPEHHRPANALNWARRPALGRAQQSRHIMTYQIELRDKIKPSASANRRFLA